MSPGVGEEAGQTARGVVDALKSQPITLALVVFNVVFLFILYFSNREESIRIEAFQTKLFEQQGKTMEMLFNCTPVVAPK